MPDETNKTERIYVRVTPEAKTKIEALSDIRGLSASDLLREKGVSDLIAEHDRIMAYARGASSESDAA